MNTHGLNFAVNCSILLKDLPLLERPAAAKAAGFDAIELWWPFDVSNPSSRDVDEFVRAIGDADVRLIGLNSFAGDMPAGDRGILSHPDRVAEFRENVLLLASIGERLGCSAFNVLYGNTLPGLSPEVQKQTAIDNLVVAAEILARIGGTILIESCSGIPAYPLKTAKDALAVVGDARGAGASNVAFLLDVYHLAANGDDPLAAIDTVAEQTGHVQIADFPGRGAPGTADLDLVRVFDSLRSRRPAGWIGLEYQSVDGDPFAWLPRTDRGSSNSTETRSTGGTEA